MLVFFPCVVMIYYWAALPSPASSMWMLVFFCMIMLYTEIQPWIDNYQVFVWVLVGLHHSFVILQKLGSWKYLIKILFQHWALVLLFGGLFSSLSLLFFFGSDKHVDFWRRQMVEHLYEQSDCKYWFIGVVLNILNWNVNTWSPITWKSGAPCQ